jgi:hypothetical protein
MDQSPLRPRGQAPRYSAAAGVCRRFLQTLPANIPSAETNVVRFEKSALSIEQIGSNLSSSATGSAPASEILILRQGKF